MSKSGEKLQDAIGLVSDEYILEAHGLEAESAASATRGDAPATVEPAGQSAAAVIAAFQGGGAEVGGGPQPPSRKRGALRLSVPAAIAACLVIVIGVGVFAFFSMPKPSEYAGTPVELVTAESDSATTPRHLRRVKPRSMH